MRKENLACDILKSRSSKISYTTLVSSSKDNTRRKKVQQIILQKYSPPPTTLHGIFLPLFLGLGNWMGFGLEEVSRQDTDRAWDMLVRLGASSSAFAITKSIRSGWSQEKEERHAELRLPGWSQPRWVKSPSIHRHMNKTNAYFSTLRCEAVCHKHYHGNSTKRHSPIIPL